MSAKRKPRIQPKPHFNSIEPLNDEQAEYIKLIHENDIIICSGRAGCGKTAIAAALGAELLFYRKVSKIILTRSMITAEKTGFLPGTLDKKIEPFLDPMLTELSYFMDVEKAVRENTILFKPLAYMRGVTFKDSFIIADESQNSDSTLLKLLLTRFGYGSKMVITGDLTQSDLKGDGSHSFRDVIEKIVLPLATPDNKIAVINLKESVRHPLVELLAEQFEKVYGV